jgi:2-iminobutanoate/2-iminopropanoate deaminase
MKAINSSKAPSAIGPYSQAIDLGDIVFVSGQIPIDVNTGKFVGTDIKSQTIQVMENIKSILEEGKLKMSNIVKTTILLDSMDDFAVVNDIYGEYFSQPYPARATFEVSKLPLGALIEIESIAKK